MIRKFKALGLAMAAVLAMSAVVASVAQAQFTASSYPTTITATSASGNDVFTVDGTTVECAGHFQGFLEEATTSEWIYPSYTSCKAFGFASATVEVHFCKYVLHSDGELDLGCAYFDILKGEWYEYPLTITAGNCEVRIYSQSGLKSVALANFGSHILADANVSGIKAEVSKDGFLCPLNGIGQKTATYTQANALTVKPVSGGTSISVD